MATANQKQESAKLSPQERTQRMQALSQARHALFVAEKLTRASAKARKATAQAFLDAHSALPGAPVMSEAEGVAIRACLGLGPKASTEQVLSALHPGLVRLNSRVTTAKRISARASARHASLSAAEKPKPGQVQWWRCADCGQEYRLETFEEVCPFCGGAAGEGFYAPPSHKPAKGRKPGEKAASSRKASAIDRQVSEKLRASAERNRFLTEFCARPENRKLDLVSLAINARKAAGPKWLTRNHAGIEWPANDISRYAQKSRKQSR